MKKKQVNEIFIDEARRKKKIISYICLISLITLLSVISLFFYYNQSKNLFVNYKEYSDLDYDVKLKSNDFFNNGSLEQGNNYISQLIDHIDAKFKYKLDVLEENIDYDYSYRIEALVNVKEKSSDKSLYKYNEIIKQENILEGNSNSPLEINEDVIINYNKYNDLINKFINTYDLEDTESTLFVNMYINVFGNCGNVNSNKKESVISLDIPLTTKTVDIDITSDLIDNNNDNVLICKNKDNRVVLFLVFSIIGFVFALYFTIEICKYIRNTRTPQSIYEIELKRILNNYKSYIQKINNEFDLTGYQVLKVDTFSDMLEIRDTVASPILMVENKKKTETFFLITSNTKVLYCYKLKVQKGGTVHEG